MSSTLPVLFATHPETGELLRRRWSLEVVEGTDRGTTAEITQAPALVGAAPAATLVITDDTVSRYHLEIDVRASGLHLRDLDSTNGTYVQEARIKTAFVEAGEVFRAGRTAIRAIAEDEPAGSEIDTDPHGVPPGGIERVGRAIGVAGATRELLRIVRLVAPSSSPVLFTGEDGSGRATYAEVLHELGPRRAQPFVTVALSGGEEPAGVVERLLGRATKGGPAAPGAFEEARGGTLLIEGLEHLPQAAAALLLRALEAGEVERPGEDRKLQADFRFVASSSRHPASIPGFDPRLARRVAVVHVVVPPFAERAADVRPIAELFLARLPLGRPVLGERAAALLAPPAFHGNLDELRGLIAHLAPGARPGGVAAPPAGLAQALRLAFVTDRVVERRGDVTAAAADLGLTTKGLFRFLAEHRVDLDGL